MINISKPRNLATKKPSNPAKAFTLVELLIIVAIILILAAVTIPLYGNFQVRAQLNDNSAQVMQTIRVARERSLSGYNNQPHGVKFETDSYTLYQGNSYLGRDPNYDREIPLESPPLVLTTDLTNNEVNFSQGLGIPNDSGQVVLSHDLEGTRRLNINSLGMVDED